MKKLLIATLATAAVGGAFADPLVYDYIFKATHGKRRFFKMAPIHHHLELCGLSEVKIVAVFLAVTVCVCAASYFLIINF